MAELTYRTLRENIADIIRKRIPGFHLIFLSRIQREERLQASHSKWININNEEGL